MTDLNGARRGASITRLRRDEARRGMHICARTSCSDSLRRDEIDPARWGRVIAARLALDSM
jgi:hypothetical protein